MVKHVIDYVPIPNPYLRKIIGVHSNHIFAILVVGFWQITCHPHDHSRSSWHRNSRCHSPLRRGRMTPTRAWRRMTGRQCGQGLRALGMGRAACFERSTTCDCIISLGEPASNVISQDFIHHPMLREWQYGALPQHHEPQRKTRHLEKLAAMPTNVAFKLSECYLRST